MGTATEVATPDPPGNPQKKCAPFSISLAVLAPDSRRQISFGITRGCNADDTSFYLLHFILRDKVAGGFQDRVVLDVRVNTQENVLAEKLAFEGLKRAQLDFLSGPITSAAKKLPPGSTSDDKTAAKMQQLIKVA